MLLAGRPTLRKRRLKKHGAEGKEKVVPVAVREVKVGQANAQNAPVVSQPKQQAAEVSSSTSVTTKSEIQKTTAGTVAPSLVSAQKYHVIIASVGTEKDAEAMAKQLIEKVTLMQKQLLEMVKCVSALSLVAQKQKHIRH